MTALRKRSLVPKGDLLAPPEGPSPRRPESGIRTRSRGKFDADGWSTSSSRVNYMLVAAVMLSSSLHWPISRLARWG